MGTDWLLGADRHDTAAEHIYAAAVNLIAASGFDSLDIETVARHAHCSRATVYRHTGGVRYLRETVLIRAADRITDVIRKAIGELTGPDRLYDALTIALREVRSDTIFTAFLSSQHGPRSVVTLAESPALLRIASEVLGTHPDDPLTATWFIRTMLSLLLWPTDADTEAQLLRRFLIPALHPHPGYTQPPDAATTAQLTGSAVFTRM
ncbi:MULTISPECIES: TetR/AcrR family transcriptional regulator [Nocardia]|uniref:TetR/AcrR family transcriptional regulator n=1 Tax=Nocardia TaxID=1817 RepID=UPI00130022DA|nr:MULTISPECIES: TetR/AcrR family transcriptional regulator [Nocardia]